jgi:hypothetical protein
VEKWKQALAPAMVRNTYRQKQSTPGLTGKKEMLCLLCQTPTASFAQEEQRTMGQSERWLRRSLGGPKLVVPEERRGTSLCRCLLGYLRS